MKQIIQKRKYTYGFSILLTLAGFFALAFWGLRFGIDFLGGTTLTASIAKEGGISADQLRQDLVEKNLSGLTVQTLSSGNVLVQFGASESSGSDDVLDAIHKQDSEAKIVDTKTVGGVVSGEMRARSVQAVVAATIGIALYIAWAFRKVLRPVSSWLYGAGALVALLHDIVIVLGVFAVLGHFYGIEVDVPFIAALLTILGYSIHDTIVVYDRVRENIFRYGRHDDFETVVNKSLNETMTRSLNTSFTVVIVLLAIILFGGHSIMYFSLALLVGVIAGTYSSIFVASALLVTMENWKSIKFIKS